jgi:nicotinamidase-related amidase
VPINLQELAAAEHSAVLTMEIQRGVVGDLSSFPELAAATKDSDLVAHTAELLHAARDCGVPVVHCIAEFRADRRGSAPNAPLITAMLRRPEHLLVGSPAAEIVPGLDVHATDIICARRHGVSPFIGTNLDPTLRNLGVTTVIATGVSLNLGILGLVIEAVNLGYRVVVATDAVTGIPADYALSVLRNSLSLVATLSTTTEVATVFRATTEV